MKKYHLFILTLILFCTPVHAQMDGTKSEFSNLLTEILRDVKDALDTVDKAHATTSWHLNQDVGTSPKDLPDDWLLVRSILESVMLKASSAMNLSPVDERRYEVEIEEYTNCLTQSSAIDKLNGLESSLFDSLMQSRNSSKELDRLNEALISLSDAVFNLQDILFSMNGASSVAGMYSGTTSFTYWGERWLESIGIVVDAIKTTQIQNSYAREQISRNIKVLEPRLATLSQNITWLKNGNCFINKKVAIICKFLSYPNTEFNGTALFTEKSISVIGQGKKLEAKSAEIIPLKGETGNLIVKRDGSFTARDPAVGELIRGSFKPPLFNQVSFVIIRSGVETGNCKVP